MLTEYRGLTVTALAELRGALRPASTEYKVFKNTLARRAAEDAGLTDLLPFLEGPSRSRSSTATPSSPPRPCGTSAAPTRRSSSRAVCSARGSSPRPRSDSLADIEPRDVLLARLAGGFQAPLTKAAGLFQAFTRNLAYGIKAYIDERDAGEPDEPRPPSPTPRPPRPSRTPSPPAADADPAPDAASPEASGEASSDPDRGPARRPSRLPARRADMATLTTPELLDVFKNMTVLELNEFLKAFEDEFGVTAAAPVAVAAGPAPAEAPAAEEQDEFDVHLTDARREEDPGHQGAADPHQPRAQGGEGPRGRLPPSVLEKVSKEDAEKAKAQLEGAGATVELK